MFKSLIIISESLHFVKKKFKKKCGKKQKKLYIWTKFPLKIKQKQIKTDVTLLSI